MNLHDYHRHFRQKVVLTAFLAFTLLAWIGWTLYQQTVAFNATVLTVPSQATKLLISRENEQLTLARQGNQYFIQWSTDSQLLVSPTVTDALFSKLNTTCLDNFPANEVDTLWHSTLTLETAKKTTKLEIGEQNPVSKQVYVKFGDTAYACDELVLSIVRAPKAQLLAKGLPFASLATINDLPITVAPTIVEVVPTAIENIQGNVMKTFKMTGTDFQGKPLTREFNLLTTEKPDHWLWYEPSLGIIYVVKKPVSLGEFAFLDE